jgi:hypothetical protein
MISPFLQATKALRESRGIALFYFQTSALEGGEGSASRPSRLLPPGKTRYPLCRRLGGPQGRSGQARKISPPPGFDPRTVQPVASRYIHNVFISIFIIYNVKHNYYNCRCLYCLLVTRFGTLLGHHQAILEACFPLVHCIISTLFTSILQLLHCHKRSLI